MNSYTTGSVIGTGSNYLYFAILTGYCPSSCLLHNYSTNKYVNMKYSALTD